MSNNINSATDKGQGGANGGEPKPRNNEKDPYPQNRHYKAMYSLLIALLLFSILFLLGTAAKSLGLFSLGEQLPNYSAVTVNLECLKYKWPEYKHENIDECSTLITEAFARAKLPTKDDLEVLDKRIGDIGTIAQILGVGTGIFGILITVLVIYFAMNERERMEDFIAKKIVEIESAKASASTAADAANKAAAEANTALNATNVSVATVIMEAAKVSTAADAANKVADEARTILDESKKNQEDADAKMKKIMDDIRKDSMKKNDDEKFVEDFKLAIQGKKGLKGLRPEQITYKDGLVITIDNESWKIKSIDEITDHTKWLDIVNALTTKNNSMRINLDNKTTITITIE